MMKNDLKLSSDVYFMEQKYFYDLTDNVKNSRDEMSRKLTKKFAVGLIGEK